ncbi:cryptochrome/photolyase family protein [Terrimonas alba]|uniref:cryptochrome/photolyase family protein n=1 Tax=Terrimonas alba TaxID=3349636 RepID=UPI0035F363A7
MAENLFTQSNATLRRSTLTLKNADILQLSYSRAIRKNYMREINICWLRRDLRLDDNVALYHALKAKLPVLIIFIFDTDILGKLPSKKDKRVAFIHAALENINALLEKEGTALYIVNNTPLNAFQKIVNEFDVKEVFTNHDYEPYAMERDTRIEKFLKGKNILFHRFKDQVIFEKSDILKDDGKPYNVYTPYSKKWKLHFEKQGISQFPSEKHLDRLLPTGPHHFPTLTELGFEKTETVNPIPVIDEKIIQHYQQTRNIPGMEGTTRLSVHLRFGTVSVRQLVKLASNLNEQWLNELIWREFFMMILFHYPHVVTHSFKPKYDHIKWRNNEKEFEAWCKGETGYPIVDAGMRQLNKTGWMHNRVRMIVASFLIKHLLIDWRWGEAYFAEKLLDYELSSNNGNWQWAAGSGCDAAPYFRIFNPAEQIRKFDPELKYINQWIKNFSPDYLTPIVKHEFARKRALEVYKKSLE